MAIKLTPQESEEVIHSLKKYCSSELDLELSELKAKLLLDYLQQEIAPLAYNQGVRDAEEYFRARVEDLPGIVFEPGLTYWQKKRK